MIFKQQIIHSHLFSQITTNIHLSCYCTVLVYVVLHFVMVCDRFEWNEWFCSGFILLFTYICTDVWDSFSRGWLGELGWNWFYLFNPPHVVLVPLPTIDLDDHRPSPNHRSWWPSAYVAVFQLFVLLLLAGLLTVTV